MSVQESLSIEKRKKAMVYPLRRKNVSTRKRKRNLLKKRRKRKCFGMSLFLDFKLLALFTPGEIEWGNLTKTETSNEEKER